MLIIMVLGWKRKRGEKESELGDWKKRWWNPSLGFPVKKINQFSLWVMIHCVEGP